MENVRLSKIERLLQKELSEIFRRQTQLSHGILVSVTTVRVSADLSIARAYLSIFPSEKGDEILKSIRQNARTIRYELGQQVRMQLRKIPELSFFIDDSLDYIDNINKLLNN
ncbi:MAG: 30S ribosome-binding factor RbfA [Tannerellaceae bacterium]|jgi:ribosome-binding factor A|nr:30S ribosome-binding factor RbfA [Tannerellaceae bacterium]